MSIEGRGELLRLADVVHAKLVLYCAFHAPRERYEDGAHAFWAMCQRIAGNEAAAAKSEAKLSDGARAIMAEADKRRAAREWQP